jgi:hypothetical protein
MKTPRGHETKNGHSKKGSALYSLPTLYRGIYSRVAQKVGCDPSYVSRVARGERQSNEVARALQAEIRRTLALSSRQLGQSAFREGGSRQGRASRA